MQPKHVKFNKSLDCPLCKGIGILHWNNHDEGDGDVCFACMGKGSRQEYLEGKVKQLQKGLNATESNLRSEIKHLESWILKNNKCKTCQGNRNNTLTNWPCEECGLIGLMPYGG